MALAIRGNQFFNRGQEEPQRLPRARLGARKDVLAGHDGRQRLVLHGCGVGEPLDLPECFEGCLAEAQVGKRNRGGRIATCIVGAATARVPEIE